MAGKRAAALEEYTRGRARLGQKAPTSTWEVRSAVEQGKQGTLACACAWKGLIASTAPSAAVVRESERTHCCPGRGLVTDWGPLGPVGCGQPSIAICRKTRGRQTRPSSVTLGSA